MADSRPRYRDLPDAQKFGYEVEREKAQIRWELAGIPMDPIRRHFAVEAEYTRRHASEPTYAEIGAARRARDDFSTLTHRLQLTTEELAFLSEHFDGANDPMAAAILAKVRRLLR